jgi:hypothetical protein
MKKSLILIMTAVLLLLCGVSACAEEAKEPADLFDLWDYGGESPVWVASAVPVSAGIALISPAALPENTEYLAVSDGRESWEVKAVLPDSDNLIALVLFDPAEKPDSYDVWQLLAYGESAAASSCYVRYGDGMGSRINRAVLSAEELQWQGRRCYLLTLTDPVPAGSPVLTADGELAAVVVAEWAEGISRVLALPAEEIAGSLSETAALLEYLPDWGKAPEGLSVKLEKNQATIDWSEMTLPEKAAGEQLYLVVADMGNNYLNFYPAESDERSLTLQLTPGRLYLAGVTASSQTPRNLPEEYTVFSAPPAKKLTQYNFRPVLTAIAEAPPDGLKDGEKPVPVAEVTAELLLSGRAYFYSHCTYEVTGEIRDLPLLVTLTDPTEKNYCWESGWVYAPEYMNGDIWYVPLIDTGLVAGLDPDNYARGVYRMAFYVDGDLADRFEFELK